MRFVSWLMLAAVAVTGGCGGRSPGPTGVILIDIDTLRADGLGCYGNGGGTSPHIDALAARGARFEWAFSQAPYTLPSQVSILTSLYPWSHGVIAEDQRLGPDAVTLAEVFQSAGWRTAAFVDGGYVSAHFGFDQGFDEFSDSDRGGVRRIGPVVENWLKREHERPFFLLVHTYDPHTPYAPDEPFRSRFVARVEPPTPGFEPTTDALESIRESQWSPPQRRLEPRDLAYARALYDGEVAMVDHWVGRWLHALEERGTLDSTVVAVISDHGEEFQEHGSLLHEKLYSTVTRVPMILAGPGVDAGRVLASTAETIDLFPTILDLAGIQGPAAIDGRSLAAALADSADEPGARASLAHSRFWGEQRAIIDDQFHLIVTLSSGRSELFRYREDPTEQVDLAAGDQATVRRLVRRLRARVDALDRERRLTESAELSPEIEASLKALGYLR